MSVAASGAPPTPPAPVPLGAPVRERGTSLHQSVRAESWVARGVTKVTGSVETGSADLGGTVVVGGDVSARELVLHGALDVVGSVSVEADLSAHGSLRAGRGVRAAEATITGSFRTDGAVEVRGRLVARGTFEAASVVASESRLAGTVRVTGEVRAALVDLELGEGSVLAKVVGADVHAVGPEGNLIDRVLGRSRQARIERIEGERVTLEHVEVGSVFATEVTVGRDCHVGEVLAGRLHAHPTSRIGPESRTPPPHGLRR